MDHNVARKLAAAALQAAQGGFTAEALDLLARGEALDPARLVDGQSWAELRKTLAPPTRS